MGINMTAQAVSLSNTKNNRGEFLFDPSNLYLAIMNLSWGSTPAKSLQVDDPATKLQELNTFADLAYKAEQRTPLWKGRTQAVLTIAMDLNYAAGSKVDPMQLEAAVYLHDIGMLFLPLEATCITRALNKHDRQSLRLHPNMGAKLLADKPRWQEAAEIILQHHEREDGKGYPLGLEGKQICDGAKILAIADTIESIVNRRNSDDEKYPVSQAIREINKNQGTQFSPYWVALFNDVIRSNNGD